MSKKTLLSILIGMVAGYLLFIIGLNLLFVFKVILCILALRYLFGEFPDAD